MEDGRPFDFAQGKLPPVSACNFPVLLYYITDRTQFLGDEATRCRLLLEKIAEAARAGVDLIQLREKDLSTRDLEALALAAAEVIRENSQLGTRLLINSRADIAIACGAGGVHLRSKDISPREVRELWTKHFKARDREVDSPVVGVSCHSVADISHAASEQASFAVFGPVFEKKDDPKVCLAGLASLEAASSQKIPLLALGGITLENAHSCVQAGAAGVAGIRIFQDNVIAQVVQALRG
ncbi:MAG: thiamine phosphate synthase [Terriglobales bacterium]